MLCVTKLSSIQYKDIKCLSFVLLSPGSTEGYFINHCSCFRSPPPEGEEAVKKLSRSHYFHSWLWSLAFRLLLEIGLEITKEKISSLGKWILSELPDEVKIYPKHHYKHRPSPKNPPIKSAPRDPSFLSGGFLFMMLPAGKRTKRTTSVWLF